MWKFMLSETARSLLWLWENDPEGWRVDEYAAVHPASGVGVWTANHVYGLDARYAIQRGHILSGKKIALSWPDRRALYRAMRARGTMRHGGPIPFAISKWAMIGDRFAKAEIA